MYTGKHADRGGSPDGWKRALPWVVLGLAVTLQILSLLLPETSNILLPTLLIAFLLVMVAHSTFTRGGTWTAVFVGVTLAIGLIVESLGAATGFPFGSSVYDYSTGPTLFRVPLLIILSWPPMSYLVLVAVDRLSLSPSTRVFVSAWLWTSLVALFDPTMDPARVSRESDWMLPGTPLPLQYVLGLFLVGILMFALLDRMPRKIANDTLPFTALSWMFISGIAGTAMLGVTGVSIWAGTGVGLVILPLWWKLWSEPNW